MKRIHLFRLTIFIAVTSPLSPYLSTVILSSFLLPLMRFMRSFKIFPFFLSPSTYVFFFSLRFYSLSLIVPFFNSRTKERYDNGITGKCDETLQEYQLNTFKCYRTFEQYHNLMDDSLSKRNFWPRIYEGKI